MASYRHTTPKVEGAQRLKDVQATISIGGIPQEPFLAIHQSRSWKSIYRNPVV